MASNDHISSHGPSHAEKETMLENSLSESPNVKTIDSGHPLMWNQGTKLLMAAHTGCYHTVKSLLEEGVNPNEQNSLGNTPLHLASKALAIEVMDLLLNSGADVNMQNKLSMTPLHYLLLSGRRNKPHKSEEAIECLRLLLDHKADVNLKNNTGLTVLHLAAIRSEEKWVDVLLEANADLCSKTSDGIPALYIVMKNCPKSIQKSLDACIEGFDGMMNKGTIEGILSSSAKTSPEIMLSFVHLQSMNTCDPSDPNDPTTFLMNVLDTKKKKDPALNSVVNDIFMHPASQAYVYYKWSNVELLYYICILFSHFVYSVVFSVYAVLVYKDICKPGGVFERGTNDCTSHWNQEENWLKRRIVLTCWMMLMVFTGIFITKELTVLLNRKYRNKSRSQTVLSWLVILLFALASFHENTFGDRKVTLKDYQYHASAYGVFTTWLLMMLLLGRATKVGLYVKLFRRVAHTFFLSFAAYTCIIIAFVLSFYILFPQHDFTDTLPNALLKVLTMLVELDDGLLQTSDDTISGVIVNGSHITAQIEHKLQQVYFPVTANIFVTLFIFFMAIIMINLLFGLAVTDVQDQLHGFKLRLLMQQLEMISHIDSTMILLPNCVKMCLQRVLKKLSNKLAHKCVRYGKEDYKIKNCQIVGADVNPNRALSRDAEKQLKRLSSCYEFVHFRLPDYIMRLIYDRHKEIQIQRSDWEKDNENLEKLLVRTLNDNFDRLVKTLKQGSMLERRPVGRTTSFPTSIPEIVQQISQNKKGKYECGLSAGGRDEVNDVTQSQVQLQVIRE